MLYKYKKITDYIEKWGRDGGANMQQTRVASRDN